MKSKPELCLIALKEICFVSSGEHTVISRLHVAGFVLVFYTSYHA